MSIRLLSIFMLFSGAAALILEMVWLRRLSLQLGSAGLSATVTLAIYMGGLGIGALLGGRIDSKYPVKSYGLLELFVAVWALLFPWLLDAVGPTFYGNAGSSFFLSIPLLLPPAVAHGATLPILSTVVKKVDKLGWLYAMNTFGAVCGVLGSAFVLLPSFGVRGSELTAMGLCFFVGFVGLIAPINAQPQSFTKIGKGSHLPWNVFILMLVTGLVSMSLEVVWSRLGALLIGGSVYAFAIVLAVFLLGIAFGAHLGRKLDKDLLAHVAIAMGLCTVMGAYTWRWLPHGLAIGWDWFGDGSLLPVGALLLSLAMAGAPIASGAMFSLCLKHGKGDINGVSANVLLANTIGGVVGVLLTGPLLMPSLGIVNTTLLLSSLCIIGGVFILWSKDSRISLGTIGGFVLLTIMLPKWDVAVYATGLYNRIGEFVDLSPRAIEQFAHEGWEPRLYVDGHSASIAVGQSTRTENLWLSINGKVDASTGDDMPTQILSGELPLKIHSKDHQVNTLVVGLASGVTANEARKYGAQPLTVVELEPSIVDAARLFKGVNDGVVDHPNSIIRVADARAVLQHEERSYDVIISEPSNPWITGVSNLFTVEYWELGRRRLHVEGVFCQWVQLYALPPDGMRSLIASYLSVFPNTWLFETIPGSDALLISAPELPTGLPIEPTLGPDELQNLAEGVVLNTDDKPWIEFEAPKWVNRPTGRMNRELIESAKIDE